MSRSEQASNDVLVQRSTLGKGLIKFNKANGINPMTIHVQIADLRLFGQKNQQLNEKWVEPIAHVWQSRKKRTSPSSCAIIAFFVVTNL
jgi:hypothetical protein